MDKFKNVLKKRLALGVVFNVLIVIFIVLTAMYTHQTVVGSEDITDAIRGFQVGIFMGIQMVMLFFIGKYTKALKNDDKLKKLYIEEKDERTKLIEDKIGGVGFNFVIGAIAAATVIAGFFDVKVFLTLLGVLVFVVFVKAPLKLYYRNKF